ncbi:hypothetical protein V9K67_10000 [Paraflavisolibacter sp. H34]|uniref:hypothetical protein n=1 Tax=Huijunlia imazamoxiresistens TaxID=3127457 RepID=UPI003015E760
MRNKRILYARQEAEIYRAYYKPSINLIRFFRSIFGVLKSGSMIEHEKESMKKIYSK